MLNHLCYRSKIINKQIINESKLINQYYNLFPDPRNNKEHRIIFGTSGHRGSAQRYNFNEIHVLAISQAIVQIRLKYGIHGPCFIGKDTHILSEPAFISVLEVLSANCINIFIQKNYEYTPTPVISNAIVNYNKKQNDFNFFKKADGIIMTSSHNPPEDGGIKYSSIFGGPAPIHMTNEIEQYANNLLIYKLKKINRISLSQALRSGYIHYVDFAQNYIKNLSKIIRMNDIQTSGLKLGVDPLSGSSIMYWQNIAQYYKLNLTIINEKVDRTFSFMYVDNFDQIRIDCSSDVILVKAIQESKNFDLFFINDPDCDRHGIVTPVGLMKSNYYFAVVIHYLFNNRSLWKNRVLSIGKTNVSSYIINQVAFDLHRRILEVPVGFKWFSKGLFDSNLGFAGEDSAGASFLDNNCIPWSTDKDGFIMCLLAAEIVAITNQSLSEYYIKLNKYFKNFSYSCRYINITYKQKLLIFHTLFEDINIVEIAGDFIITVLSIVPVHGKITMNGVKIVTHNGWVACRLSGTELVYKIYCESFLGEAHRKKMESEIIHRIYNIL